jgi:drug/metabolite transporter (DMT)-like permease
MTLVSRKWPQFWLLCLIWGSSFLFIRIGVEHVPPLQLVFIRTLIAALGLNAVLLWQGKSLPKDKRSLLDLLVLGIVNTVLPFFLITWGETYIESSMASILQGTAALFTLLVAHFAFNDERITLRKLLGLMTGFLGVVVLAYRGAALDLEAKPVLYLLGQLAVVVASFCYAIGGSYSRKAMQQRLEPLQASAGAMTVAAVTTGVMMFITPKLGGLPPVDVRQLDSGVIVAILALGFINTFIAYLIFYALVVKLGAARTSMVTYVIPVVGLLLGIIFLGEKLEYRLILGAVMIVGSIAVVNLKLERLFKRSKISP